MYDDDVDLQSWDPPANCTDPTTAADKVTCFSQSSDDLDLLAPGSITLSTWPFSPFTASISGTSMASPHAVAVGALMLDALPTLTPDAVAARLSKTGKLVVDQFNDADPDTLRTTPRVDARVALLTDNNADFDEDGCANGAEFGDDETAGGLRNPLLHWDFMDQYTGVPLAKDGGVVANDMSAVVARFGTLRGSTPTKDEALAEALITPTDATSYHPSADRGGGVLGANPWDLLPPDGGIVANDISAVVAQFGHTCA